MNNVQSPLRSLLLNCHNLKTLDNFCHLSTSYIYTENPLVPAKPFGLSYSTKSYQWKQADYDEKRKKFQELEVQYRKLLNIDKLTTEEKRIHNLHAEAVARGHFTYDDPSSNEKVLTRLRHFLKGKCCGKSCRHCIYEHSAVVDEKKKAKAKFNTSFWIYDGEEEELIEFDDQHVAQYGRGPYPRKYAENAPQNMIKVFSNPK